MTVHSMCHSALLLITVTLLLAAAPALALSSGDPPTNGPVSAIAAEADAAGLSAAAARALADAVAESRARLPTQTEDSILRASNAEANDAFASSVSISGDRALVGAANEGGPANGTFRSGAAYVFELSGGVWTETAVLRASNAGAEDSFGGSVSLDGDRAVVSAYGEDGPSNGVFGAGAAYVFDLTGVVWTETAILRASNAGEGDFFGRSVSLDGDRALVGAPNEDNPTNSASAGAAYVFDLSGAAWGETAILRASNAGESDYFGGSVSLSGDRALVGADGEAGPTDSGYGFGAAYVFDLSGAAWTESALLRASNTEERDNFGYSVSLDGDRALIGAPYEGGSSNSASDAGAAYVFDLSGAAWTETALLRASNAEADDAFGASVSLDGDRALVAAPYEAGSANSTSYSGAAYVFDLSGAAWAETTLLRASNAGANDYFGEFVSLDGDRALVGAIGEEGPTNSAGIAGATYVFGIAPTPPSVPDVDIQYISSTANPKRGQNVIIRARATNNETATVRTRVYFEVLYPNGTDRTYSVLSADFPGNTTVQIQKIKKIKFLLPANAPTGTYTVTLYAAANIASGGAVYDTDTFTFTLASPKTGSEAASSPEAGPNPFSAETTIRYALEAEAEVDLRVFDVAGREVAVLASGVQGVGAHEAVLSASDLPSGVYVWRLTADGAVTTGRVTLAR